MLTLEITQKWMELFSEKILANKAYLSDLDTPIGDGDHGNNMARGVEAIQTTLNEKNPETVSDLFKLVAMALMSKVGGASGPLYGTAFLEMSKKSKETDDPAEIISAGLAGIEKRGGAAPGDKTMIDVWAPVSEALKEQNLTKNLIDSAVDKTKDIQARKGRASYVGERSIGHIDPGAMSSGYLFTSLLEAEA